MGFNEVPVDNVCFSFRGFANSLSLTTELERILHCIFNQWLHHVRYCFLRDLPVTFQWPAGVLDGLFSCFTALCSSCFKLPLPCFWLIFFQGVQSFNGAGCSGAAPTMSVKTGECNGALKVISCANKQAVLAQYSGNGCADSALTSQTLIVADGTCQVNKVQLYFSFSFSFSGRLFLQYKMIIALSLQMR